MSRLSVSKSESWSRSFKENTNRQNPQLTASLQRLKIAPFVCLLFFFLSKNWHWKCPKHSDEEPHWHWLDSACVPSHLNSSTFRYQNAYLGHRSHTVWQTISLPSTLRAIMKNVSTCNVFNLWNVNGC